MRTVNARIPKTPQPILSSDDALKEAFLDALLITGSLYKACTALAVSPGKILAMRKSDPDFASNCSDTISGCIDYLTSMAYTEALDPITNPKLADRLAAAKLYLSHHGALKATTITTATHTVDINTRGLAEIARAVDTYCPTINIPSDPSDPPSPDPQHPEDDEDGSF